MTEKSKEKRKASIKAWHEKHPEKRAFYARRWRKENPEKVKEYRDKNYKKQCLKDRTKVYGITPEELGEMRKSQNNKCAICNNPPNKKDLHIDHCHITGKVRALLCERCNGGIGFFRENIEVMQKAIEYIQIFSI